MSTVLAGGGAWAQTDRERDLEARVAQLESMVQQLLSQQQSLQGEQEAVRSEQQVQAARLDRLPAAPEGAQPVQATTIVPGSTPRANFTFGGFIKLDAMLTDTNDGQIADGSAGRLFYLPQAIPVGGQGDSNPYLDVHAQFSRIWFAADTTLDSGDKLRGYLEFDLFGGALGNEAATNTYGVTVRHAFATWRSWLAGQTWSNFQDVAALPDAVDFVGPTDATTFVRQSQLRYTKGPWSFSFENPETVLTPYQGNATRLLTGDNVLPDFTARYQMRGSWGHFSAAALLRSLRYENPAAGIDDSAPGYGISVSGRYNLGTSDNLRYMITGGRGINRYIGLSATTDAVIDQNGQLEPIDSLAGFVAWQHVFNPKFRSNVFYSRAEYDNDANLTGLGITKRLESWHANLIWTILPRLDLGIEGIWGKRTLERGDSGELNRLHFHARYSF
ncbi:MAG: hypothetical protein KF823_04980 [Xanthomonadales bacterium]|nr:hypothetical protein [Xanthomonadales bacterium]